MQIYAIFEGFFFDIYLRKKRPKQVFSEFFAMGLVQANKKPFNEAKPGRSLSSVVLHFNTRYCILHFITCFLFLRVGIMNQKNLADLKIRRHCAASIACLTTSHLLPADDVGTCLCLCLRLCLCLVCLCLCLCLV